MSLKIAHELFNIFVQELRARESTREDFCTQYERGFKEIPVYVAMRQRSDARAWYSRKPGHLGEIVATLDQQGTAWANEAIAALEIKLACMSPLERLDWFNEEMSHV